MDATADMLHLPRPTVVVAGAGELATAGAVRGLEVALMPGLLAVGRLGDMHDETAFNGLDADDMWVG